MSNEKNIQPLTFPIIYDPFSGYSYGNDVATNDEENRKFHHPLGKVKFKKKVYMSYNYYNNKVNTDCSYLRHKQNLNCR